ncbi:hypothetical protein B0H11DRAFT_2224556 [Mycena galericulata]|nr:hypothetical protein B0H11DRAFT_2224556 [Mycena galericulata]
MDPSPRAATVACTSHIKSLDEFAAHTEGYQILPKILKRMHNEGRHVFHSGAQPINAASTSTFTKQVIDAVIEEHQEGSTTEEDSD